MDIPNKDLTVTHNDLVYPNFFLSDLSSDMEMTKLTNCLQVSQAMSGLWKVCCTGIMPWSHMLATYYLGLSMITSIFKYNLIIMG